MNDLVTSQPQAPEPRAQAPGDFLDMIDNLAYAARARLTAGAAPTAGALAWFDWSMHLALSPGKQRSLWLDLRIIARTAMVLLGRQDRAPPC